MVGCLGIHWIATLQTRRHEPTVDHTDPAPVLDGQPSFCPGSTTTYLAPPSTPRAALHYLVPTHYNSYTLPAATPRSPKFPTTTTDLVCRATHLVTPRIGSYTYTTGTPVVSSAFTFLRGTLSPDVYGLNRFLAFPAGPRTTCRGGRRLTINAGWFTFTPPPPPG